MAARAREEVWRGFQRGKGGGLTTEQRAVIEQIRRDRRLLRPYVVKVTTSDQIAATGAFATFLVLPSSEATETFRWREVMISEVD